MSKLIYGLRANGGSKQGRVKPERRVTERGCKQGHASGTGVRKQGRARERGGAEGAETREAFTGKRGMGMRGLCDRECERLE